MSPFLNQYSKRFLITILTLGLSIAACTQGQGPAETPDKVTVAGADAPPPEDVCEKPENLENILCQWVMTEMEMGQGTDKVTYKYLFDPEGRFVQITALDSQGHRQ